MCTDFEAILKPIEGSTPNPESSYTKEINKLIPSGFCICSKFAYGKVENLIKLYRGEDCVEVLCNYVSLSYVSRKADEETPKSSTMEKIQ